MSNEEMSTAPTIETLLGRLNEWGEQFTNQFKEQGKLLDELRKGQEELRKGQEELHKGLEELRKAQEELRNDLNAGLHRVERKIQILNDNILTVNADIRGLEIRLEKLEAESLTKN